MLIFLNILCAVMLTVGSSPTTIYDQRQSGKTNVRVEVKDAVIIAVGDDEFGGDYDYSYDYSDLTIKPGQPSSTSSKPSTVALVPPKPPTSKPVSVNSFAPSSSSSSTTVSPSVNSNLTQNSALVLEAENNSIIFPSNKPGNGSGEPLKLPLPNIHKPDQIPVVVLQESHPNRPHKFLPVKTVEKQYTSSSLIRGKVSNGTVINTEELPLRHCSPGFFLDNHNRCKRIRRPVRERPQLPIGLRYEHRPLSRS